MPSCILKTKGYTFIELLIGLGLMVFLLGSSIFIYTQAIKAYYSTLAASQLDRQLHTVLQVMTQDIRRAGYSANAVDSINANANLNPFMAPKTTLRVPEKTCILFSYDTDSSGSIPPLNSPNSDKRFGYRLFQHQLQSRAPSAPAFNCQEGDWINMTDLHQIHITQLHFVLTPTVVVLANGISTLTIRNIAVSITGYLPHDASITRTFSERIRVRNDLFEP